MILDPALSTRNWSLISSRKGEVEGFLSGKEFMLPVHIKSSAEVGESE